MPRSFSHAVVITGFRISVPLPLAAARALRDEMDGSCWPISNGSFLNPDRERTTPEGVAELARLGAAGEVRWNPYW